MTARLQLQQNLEIARLFLEVLAPGEKITFQTFSEKKPKGHDELALVYHGTFDEYADTLTRLNQQGAGVFIMVNQGDSNGRKAENVQRVRAVFVDLDGASLEPVLTFSLKPHIICESSAGRYHAYWLVKDCPLEQFKPMQQVIAQRLSGDPSVKDLPRVMRLPGFFHLKDSPTMSMIRSIEDHAPYTIVQIKQAFTTTAQLTNADAIGGMRITADPDEPCPTGQRNTRLASLVGRWIIEGKTFDNVIATANDWNQRCCLPPLIDTEVQSVCASIWDKHEREHKPGNRTPAPDAGSEWEAPILFTEYKTPEIPASLLPGVYAQFAAALANATETPEAMAVFAVLGTLSTALAKRFVVSPMAGWAEPVNIYTLVALPPANNKTLVLRHCTKPLYEWQTSRALALAPELQKQRSERKNQERLIDSLRTRATRSKDLTERTRLFSEINDLEAKLPVLKAPPYLCANDATPEALANNVHEQGGRFAVITDEGGVLEVLSGLYSGGLANIDLLLKGVDGGDLHVRRKDRSFDIKPYLTFVLVVQPKIVQTMGERRAFQGNGLLERFLYVLPANKLGYRTLDTPPVPEHIQAAYNQAMRALLDLQPTIDANGQEQPRILTLDPDAQSLFREFRGYIETQLRPGGTLYACLGWGGKLSGYMLRLAGLLHVAEYGGSSAVVSLTTMARAGNIAFLLIEHARAAFNLMGIDQTQEDAKAVLQWIKSNAQLYFSRTDCFRALHGRITKSEQLSAALKRLVDRNIVRGPQAVITTPGKRAKMMYQANPQVLSAG